MLLDKDKDYVVYLLKNRGIDPEAVGGYMDYEVFRDVFETQEYGHADEWETSEILYLQPELVNLESVAGDEWLPENRLAHLKNTYTPMDWFSMQPDLTRGTPGPATAEKGRRFWAHQIDRLVDIVRAIKADDVAPRLYREFNDRLKEPPGIAEGV
jgi:creatinine amidohydrolase